MARCKRGPEPCEKRRECGRRVDLSVGYLSPRCGQVSFSVVRLLEDDSRVLSIATLRIGLADWVTAYRSYSGIT
jgi:hypothetical protein